MDKKELLKSGIIERYFLGELSQEEEALLFNQKDSDPEIQSYFEAAENKFIQIGLENNIQPSSSVKEELLQTIKNTNPTNIKKGYPFKKWFAIAAAIAILLSIAALSMYDKVSYLENELVELNEQKEMLSKEIQSITDTNMSIQKWLKFVENPEVSKLVLVGNDKLPDATTVTYVNHKKQIVMANTLGMPTLDEDKDFQLWADVDGEMIDMGVLPKNETIATLKYIPNATSYNITIEPAGGSDHPTVSELISFVTL